MKTTSAPWAASLELTIIGNSTLTAVGGVNGDDFSTDSYRCIGNELVRFAHRRV